MLPNRHKQLNWNRDKGGGIQFLCPLCASVPDGVLTTDGLPHQSSTNALQRQREQGGREKKSLLFYLMKFFIQYQDQFGRWRPYQTMNNEANAYRIAENRADSTGKRHRIVDEDGRLLDLMDP
jgi:hypothetical protein